FGDAHFRTLESKVIHSLNNESPFVVATGGGTLLLPSNRSILKELGKLVYLKWSSKTLKERIWSFPNLSSYLAPNEPYESFDRIYKERIVIYKESADYI